MPIELTAKLRKKTDSPNKLRNQDILPAVLYGQGIDNKNIQVSRLAIEKIFKMGLNTLINLSVEGDRDYTVLIKDYQGEPLTRRLTHVDFWHVKEDKEVEVDVPTRLEGKAPGLLLGGLMDHVSHTVRLTCKAANIPKEIVVDVSGLGLNQTIHLSDLTLPAGAKARPGYNPTIVSLFEEKVPVVEEAVPAAEEAAAAEGEAGAKPGEKAAGEKGGEKGVPGKKGG